LHEGQKVIETLDGRRDRLSSLAEGLLERLQQFVKAASERDQIVLVFATERALDEAQSRALSDLRAMGRQRLGTIFDVQAISIDTIYDRLLEAEAFSEPRLTVPLDAHLVPCGPDLLVGSIRLTSLYQFLKAYRDATQGISINCMKRMSENSWVAGVK
jgi:hypothetical protein